MGPEYTRTISGEVILHSLWVILSQSDKVQLLFQFGLIIRLQIDRTKLHSSSSWCRVCMGSVPFLSHQRTAP